MELGQQMERAAALSPAVDGDLNSREPAVDGKTETGEEGDVWKKRRTTSTDSVRCGAVTLAPSPRSSADAPQLAINSDALYERTYLLHSPKRILHISHGV